MVDSENVTTMYYRFSRNYSWLFSGFWLRDTETDYIFNINLYVY